jgi:hypothetical protein
MEITPMPSPLSPTAIQSSRRPSFAPHPYTAFDIELRKILTESEAGTFHYFRNEYLKGRLPVTSLVNFLKQFLDRIDHRHALIRLVYDQVIRPEEKDLFQRLVSASISSTHIPTVTQYNPSLRQSSFSGPSMTGMSQQQQQQLLPMTDASAGGSIHCISSDEDDPGGGGGSGNMMAGSTASTSGSKRRLSTTSVTSMGGNSNMNGSNTNLNVQISRNRRCSSLHLSNPGKRFLPGIPMTASDLNLNPAAANPRRASIMSNVSGSGHHLLPIPPHQQQQSSLAPPNANSLALKRHSTSRIESSSSGLTVQEDIPRRHSSTVLGVNQASNMMMPASSSGHMAMIWNPAAGNLEPESKRKYFSASANSMASSMDPMTALANASNVSSVRSLLSSGAVTSGAAAAAGNQLLVPSVNVRRSSVDVDRNSSGDEADQDSRLQLPVVSQLRRGSGNHLMIPGEEDAAPSLYLVLPQVSSSSNQRRGSTFNQGPDQFGNDTSGIPFCHTRVRRHRSLPSPFISGGSSAFTGAPSVSPPALSRRSSAIQGQLQHQAVMNATQMPIMSGGQRRMSNMQFSGSMTASAGAGEESSGGTMNQAGNNNRKGQLVTMVQGYTSPQEQQQPQQHRRSSSFRRPVSILIICLMFLFFLILLFVLVIVLLHRPDDVDADSLLTIFYSFYKD